ncbi:MAG: hypothetical protein H6577_10795 [Lewinellaceae bacterium]|nr:hypothetical protein [Saprospiraceae bacterium]MCB9338600.1 hypothetical protein [Lewinellaceae bacterium]
MKLVSEIRTLRHLAGWSAVVLALMLAPALASAGGPEFQQEQPQPSDQDAQEFTKTIKKEFPINATGTVNLINKYGKVDVKTWDKNRTKIDVTIVVKAKSESAAQDIFDRIRVDFTNDDNFVKAETLISSKQTSWWNWGDSKSEYQINYEVFMPQSGSLDLSNKYGDTTVEPITGKANVDVKYGNFRLESIGGDLSIELGYGNGTVVKARNVTADVSYSKLNLNDVQDVNFTTKYSKLFVDKGASLKAESRYDQFNLAKVDRFNCQSRYGNVEVGEAESVIAVSRYTDYRINKLRDNGDFDLEYGGLRVENLSKGFSGVNLNGKYSDFKIHVEDGASYSLDAATKYAGIGYPASLNVTYEKERGDSHEVKGHAGASGARSVIKANLDYGGLKVNQ